jgi:hypothetical protein
VNQLLHKVRKAEKGASDFGQVYFGSRVGDRKEVAIRVVPKDALQTDSNIKSRVEQLIEIKNENVL